MRLYRIIPIVAVVLLFSACTKAGIRYQDVYSSGKNYVRLAVENDKEGGPVAKGYDHPQELTDAQVRAILSDIRFQEYAFFAWRKEKPLFIESEIDRLAPHLVAALAQATPDQWIDFASSARKRDYLLPTPRVTDGWIYVEDGKLNLLLKNLNYELIDYDERALGDPHKIFTVGSYRLVTTPAQFSKPPVVKGDPIRKWDHANWLIVDLAHYTSTPDQPEAEPAVAPAPEAVEEPETEPVAEPEIESAPADEAEAPEAVPAEPAAPSMSERSIRQRLEELKELLDEGLITQDEYEIKRKELLDQL